MRAFKKITGVDSGVDFLTPTPTPTPIPAFAEPKLPTPIPTLTPTPTPIPTFAEPKLSTPTPTLRLLLRFRLLLDRNYRLIIPFRTVEALVVGREILFE